MNRVAGSSSWPLCAEGLDENAVDFVRENMGEKAERDIMKNASMDATQAGNAKMRALACERLENSVRSNKVQPPALGARFQTNQSSQQIL